MAEKRKFDFYVASTITLCGAKIKLIVANYAWLPSDRNVILKSYDLSTFQLTEQKLARIHDKILLDSKSEPSSVKFLFSNVINPLYNKPEPA